MVELAAGGSPLRYEVVEEGDGTVVVGLEGELDLSNTEDVEGALSGVIQGVTNRLVVDAAALRFADSSAIALWVNWAQRVPAIEVRNPPPLVRRVIESMGLSEVLPIP